MEVLILGIETSTEQVGCAIGGHEGVIGLFEACRGRRHAETLAPAIEFVCRQADVTLDEIGAIAVDIGPGLFTGMRVGIATATAMAHALRIPVIDVVSLDLLAFPMRYSDRIIAAVIDARRSEVYYSLYRQVPGGVQRISEAAVGTPDELIADLLARSDDVLCVGNGALRHRDQISDSVPHAAFADQWLGHPSAAPLVQLAHARALREDWKNHWELAPMYLRKPDAQINWSTRRSAP